MEKRINFADEMEDKKLIRLNKYLAHANLGTRRECDVFIEQGLVKVNGLIVTKAGTKVNVDDEISFKDELVQAEKKVYILLNKPKNVSCSETDNKITKSIYYLTYAFSEKLSLGYRPKLSPLDIMDTNDRGLIVLTNDINLLKKNSNNSNIVNVYKVKLDKELNYKDYISILKNISFCEIIDLSFIDESDKSIVGLKARTNNMNAIHKLFNSLLYDIEFMDRTVFKNLSKKDLPRGKWRFLNNNEVSKLVVGCSVL